MHQNLLHKKGTSGSFRGFSLKFNKRTFFVCFGADTKFNLLLDGFGQVEVNCCNYSPMFILASTNLMHKICFTLSLFHAYTCFVYHVLIVRRSKLYYTASGIITPVGGRLVLGTATYRCDDTRDCIIQF